MRASWAIGWLITGCAGDKDPTAGDPTDGDPTDTETDTDTIPVTDTDPGDSGTPEPTDSTTTVDCLGTSRQAQAALGTASSTTFTSTTSTGTGTTGTTSPVDTGETGIDTGFVGPGYRLWFDAVWGIDEDGCLVSTFLDGEEVVPQLNIRIGDADWAVGDFEAVDDYCTVQLLLTGGTPNPAWVTALPALYWGVGHDGASVATDCADLDPDVFTYDVVGYLLGLGGWGVAAGDLNPEVRAFLEDAGVDLSTVFGGAIRNPWVDPNDPYPSVYAFAYETDLDENVILTGGQATALAAGDIELGGGQVAQGHYTLYSLYYFEL